MTTGASPRFAKGFLPLELPAGSAITRVHWSDKGAVFFGPPAGLPPANRFDAPSGQFRIMYCSEELPGAFVETVLRRPGRIIRREEVERRAVSLLVPRRPLVLARIMDEGLQWHGVHAGEISIDDYAPSRALALDLHTTFPTLDGLAYRSRYDNGQVCFALFDRVRPTDLIVSGTTEFGGDPVTADRMMLRYGAVFDTSAAP